MKDNTTAISVCLINMLITNLTPKLQYHGQRLLCAPRTTRGSYNGYQLNEKFLCAKRHDTQRAMATGNKKKHREENNGKSAKRITSTLSNWRRRRRRWWWCQQKKTRHTKNQHTNAPTTNQTNFRSFAVLFSAAFFSYFYYHHQLHYYRHFSIIACKNFISFSLIMLLFRFLYSAQIK